MLYGSWKLIKNENTNSIALFNIDTDKEELHEVAAKNPDKVNELLTELGNWEKTSSNFPCLNL